jgi:hypothetical protein
VFETLRRHHHHGGMYDVNRKDPNFKFQNIFEPLKSILSNTGATLTMINNDSNNQQQQETAFVRAISSFHCSIGRLGYTE